MPTNTLLEQHEILRPRDTKTVRVFRFDVAPNTDALSLELQYEPVWPTEIESMRPAIQEALDAYFSGDVPDEVYAALSPNEKEDIFKSVAKEIRNSLHFSLFDSLGIFRGWWDRNHENTNPRAILSSEANEPGFIPGDIHPGQWRIELEIHSLVTNRCEFSLVVESVSKPGSSQTCRKSFGPDTRSSGPRWFRGDLHTHTHHSDGRRSFQEMVESARMAGLDYIGITDHNCTAALSEIQEDLPVTVIPGLEFTTFQGHALALNIDRHIPWTENGMPRDPSGLAEEVREQEGLFAVAHPHTPGDPIYPGCLWTDERLQAKSLDLLEVWHGDYEREAIGTIKNLLLWEALLREGYRVVAVGGGDGHDLFENELKPGMPLTMIYAQSACREHLMDGLRRGNVCITRGPLVDFRLEGVNLPVQMGDEVELLFGATYTLRLVGKEMGRGAYVRIFREAEIFVEMPLPSNRDTDLTLYCTADREETWYRVEIYRFAKPRDHLLVVTNPIYVRTKPHVVYTA
ncbi:MAG: CehA/McbA family metallohydrolase [bacterium]